MKSIFKPGQIYVLKQDPKYTRPICMLLYKKGVCWQVLQWDCKDDKEPFMTGHHLESSLKSYWDIFLDV